MRIFALALMVLIGAGVTHADVGEVTVAQAAGSAGQKNVWSGLWKRLQIRQNTNVKKDIAKPAFVNFTIPNEGPHTYQIGLGALASLLSRSRFDLDALVDYQRNSATDSLQNVFKTGATGEWRFWSTSAAGHHQSPILTYRSNFKNDQVKHARIAQTAVGYTHIFIGAAQRTSDGRQRPFIFPNLPKRLGSALQVTYFPLLELEHDRILNAGNAAEKGATTRALGQLSLELLPAYAKFDDLKQKLEFVLTYAYRTDLKDTTNERDNVHPLFTFDADYYPFKGNRGDFGFGVSYLNGEDPDAGFASETYWQFSLKMRLK